MKLRLILCVVILIQLLIPHQAIPQQVKVQAEEEKPYELYTDDQDYSQTRGLSKSQKAKATSTFLLVYLGPNGRLENISADELAQTGLQKELKFPSLNFTVSAASKLLIRRSTRRDGYIPGKIKSLTELRQMSLRVKVEGLDKERRIIKRLSQSKFGDDPVTTLSIFPSEVRYGQSKQQGAVQKASDKVDAVAQHLGPIGGIAHSVTAIFRTFFPAKDHISQIAYMDSINEFGWIWRLAEGSPIEGIHNCMALFRTHKEVKFLRVKVQVITDWRRFGAWSKSYNYIIPVKGNNEM